MVKKRTGICSAVQFVILTDVLHMNAVIGIRYHILYKKLFHTEMICQNKPRPLQIFRKN